MIFFITNASDNQLRSYGNVVITLHYYKDCELLNADYTEIKKGISNSGVKFLEFDSVEELQEYFSVFDCTYCICGKCDTQELFSLMDSNDYMKSKARFFKKYI